jgi:7-cyano-7-deazaguanine synthase
MKRTRGGRAICVLASGGFDSSVLIAELLRAGREVHPLYVRSGFYWEDAEFWWLERLLAALKSPQLRPVTVVDAPMGPALKGHWSVTGRGVPPAASPWESVYLPGRNLVLLSQAGVVCALRAIPEIALAVLKGNPFSDASPRFLTAMQGAVNAALRTRLRITAPFAGLSKDEVARRVPGFPARLTFSCLKPRGRRHCERCSKCEERRDCLRGLSAH